MRVGGVEAWTLRVASQLAAKGHDVELLEHYRPVGGREKLPPVRRRRIHTPVPFFPTEREVQDYLPAYSASLPSVIVPNYRAGSYAGCAALTRSHPGASRVIGFAHSDSRYFYDLLDYYAPIVHRFVAVSDVIARRLKARLPGRKDDVVMQPYGVPVADRHSSRTYSRPGEPLRLAYAGRLIQDQKRVLDLARLARHLIASRVPFELVIVGQGAARRRLGRVIGGLPLPADSRVILAGRIPHQEMGAIWDRADVCLLVSEYEGLSIAMLEAMGRGCVPVVTEVSGTRMMLRQGENGFAVGIGDMEVMAQVLNRLASRREELASVGARARDTVASTCSLPTHASWFASLAEEVWDLPARRWPARRPLVPPAGNWGPPAVRAATRVLSLAPFYGSARRRYRLLSDRWVVRAS
jgi:glycosyltransferase involved in cell wall biosynthesis